MACQQAIFIGWLNEYFKITLQKPVKRTQVSQQYLNIKLLERNEDKIEVEHFVNERCQQRKEYDIKIGVSESAAKQRVGKNKITESNQLLMDILTEFGYSFSSDVSDGKNGAMKIEIIKDVYKNGIFVCNKDDILTIGNRINKYLCDLVDKNQDIILELNNETLKELMKN